MSVSLLAGLVVLALVDSTSFGTLLIPLWLMLAPGRIRPARVLVFLATVATFYFALGIALTAGLVRFSDQIDRALDTTAAQVLQLVVGAALLLLSFRIGGGRPEGEPGRVMQWRERVLGEQGSATGLMVLALTAAVIEAGSMVPYLAAIGLIGTAELGWTSTLGVLAGYCLVMVLPAVVLLAGRLLAAGVVEPVLRRVDAWMVRNGPENTAWILGIVGFLLAANALGALA